MALSERFTIQTDNNLDHWFSGIMFDVEMKRDTRIPIEALQIAGIAIKGTLGDIEIFTANGTHSDKFDDENQWNKIYEQRHVSDGRRFEMFNLDEPIDLPPPGQRQAIYIHTASPDRMIRYGDEQATTTYENSFIKIYPGLGHLSDIAFDVEADWWPWRPHREFVGRLQLVAKYTLWSPLRNKFGFQGTEFQRCVYTFLLCMKRLKNEKSIAINQDVVNFILEWLHWGDFCSNKPNYQRNEVRGRNHGNAISWQTGHYHTHVRVHQAEYLRRLRGIADDEGEIGINDFDL